jgi:PAS domain S-box-containing protein
MRLSTQFKITLLVFSLLLVVIAASIVFTSQQVSKTRAQESLAYSVVQGASDLTYLSNDYVIYQGDQQLSQWQTRYNSFSQDVANLNVDTQDQQALVTDIVANQQRMKTVFDSITLTISGAKSQNANPAQTLSNLQVSWSRISIQTQAISSDGTRLAQLLRSQVDQLNTFNFILVFAIVGTFSAFLGVIYFQAFRRTLKSISELEAGAALIGSGNLDYKLKEDKKDEIGHLSKTFNQMTANLKTVTASKTDLQREIEERKKVEEALRASEQKANDLIKYAPSGIYELDYRIPPKFRKVNDAMCQILGYTREELLAINPMDLLDSEGKKRFQERIIKMLSGEKVDETVEFKIIAKDGRTIYSVLKVTFTFKDGKPDGALVIAHDVTERMKAERELEEKAKNLESVVAERTKALRDSERLAAIGATAGMVGHDIRNPLQAIISDIYLAKTELATVPDSEGKKNALESMDEIEKNTDYINKIVQDLQDYARPLNPKPEESDLREIVEKLVKKNGLPKNIKLNLKVALEATKICADSYYINRIIFNLITNSIQAMPAGGKLTIQAFKEANDIVILVKDTGVGIPEKIRDKMFSPMFTTKSKGQGFGLPVVKRMAESLGGTVTFESEEGKGTTFAVRLPIPPKS